jgi:DNA repair protein RadA/Sms
MTKSKFKSKTVYRCNECGSEAPKWAGQCPDCGAWNSLVEAVAVPTTPRGRPLLISGYAGAASGDHAVKSLAEVEPGPDLRVPTGLSELDRVLGGGLVLGSVVLIGGDPGVGKSTLLLQTLAYLSGSLPVLYVTGEESLEQVSLRARRMHLEADQLLLLADTQVEPILVQAAEKQPRVMVIDSIQTLFTEFMQSAPGSVAQVRESAAQLVRYAKQTGTALFLVGHVTKEGTLAGPRVLEHMVDTVLYFEGDTGTPFRVVRAIKNRFGAVNELGVFAMSDRGLKEVSNPSAIFLSRHDQAVAGSVIMVTREGTRPLLVEVQTLVAESHLSNPRRVTVGLDQNRLSMLLAVLQRHAGIAMYDQDVFVNVVGGVRITETGADLAVLLAVLSSLRDRPLADGLVVFGEVGLAGEIRPVQGGLDRLREAAKHGYKRAIVPKANAPKQAMAEIEVLGVRRLSDAIEAL